MREVRPDLATARANVGGGLWQAYRYRLKRRSYLWRAFRARRGLQSVVDRTGQIGRGDILLFACLRNEALRLPHFFDHYRRLGVTQFLIVDNGSDDGSAEWLAGQADVSLWRAEGSYKAARFGMDWVNWLLTRYGHGHWCLTVDADEVLIYDDWERRTLVDLTRWLEARGQAGFGALMLEMYPEGPLAAQEYRPGDDPFALLCGFDAGGYRQQRQRGLENLWVQGGPRDRVFFADRPEKAPTLNKLPLLRWRRGMIYVTSTHSALPRSLNYLYEGPGREVPGGLLLHSKFLPDIAARSAEESQRGEHFFEPGAFAGYYVSLQQNPTFWCETTTRYRNWRQLCELGLMSPIPWDRADVTG